MNDLKKVRQDNGKRSWGKLEPEVLRVINLITLNLFIVRAISKNVLSDVMEVSFKEIIEGEPTIDAKETLLDGASKFYSLNDYSVDDYLKDQSTHSGYHLRTTEWKQVWG